MCTGRESRAHHRHYYLSRGLSDVNDKQRNRRYVLPDIPYLVLISQSTDQVVRVVKKERQKLRPGDDLVPPDNNAKFANNAAR